MLLIPQVAHNVLSIKILHSVNRAIRRRLRCQWLAAAAERRRLEVADFGYPHGGYRKRTLSRKIVEQRQHVWRLASRAALTPFRFFLSRLLSQSFFGSVG